VAAPPHPTGRHLYAGFRCAGFLRELLSERNPEAAGNPEGQNRSTGARVAPRRLVRAWVEGHVWWVVAVALVMASALLVRWAGTRPSYDSYGWLIWGHQTLHLTLNLGGAPSWKPLPFLFTVSYAVFGTHRELQLWMITAVALGLAGAIFGGRIAFHVVAAERDAASWSNWLAAAFAGAAVLALQDYMHYVLSVQSDPVIVSLTLAGIDAHIRGRRAWAFAFGMLASLGRPEAWCLLGPYSVYLWLRVQNLRWVVAAGWALILFMWFGIPTITNDRPFVSAQLALGSPRQLRGDRFTGALHRFWDLYNVPLWIAAGLTLLWAVVRRNRTVVALGVAAVLWVITEVAFAYHGWPALPRYMFEAGAISGVLAGIGFGWLLTGSLPGLVRSGRVARAAAPVLAAALVLVLLPYARIRYEQEHDDLRVQRVRTDEIEQLRRSIAALGGTAHIQRCGQPTAYVEWASVLAFYMNLDVAAVEYRPAYAITRKPTPIVDFTPVPDGWRVRAWHTPMGMRRACSDLRAIDVARGGHPDGLVIPY
jgi:hypothetical protein